MSTRLNKSSKFDQSLSYFEAWNCLGIWDCEIITFKYLSFFDHTILRPSLCAYLSISVNTGTFHTFLLPTFAVRFEMLIFIPVSSSFPHLYTVIPTTASRLSDLHFQSLHINQSTILSIMKFIDPRILGLNHGEYSVRHIRRYIAMSWFSHHCQTRWKMIRNELSPRFFSLACFSPIFIMDPANASTKQCANYGLKIRHSTFLNFI